MRTILLFAALFASQAYAEELQFTATGTFSDFAANGVPTFWNESFPEPTTFSMTFDVNTLDPANSATYDFQSSPDGPIINNITANFVATNIVLSLDGNVVESGATGSFGFGGQNMGGNGGQFIATGGAHAGTTTTSFGFAGDFVLGEYEQSVLQGSNDPFALILNGSQVFNDIGLPSLFSFGSSELGADIVIRSDGAVSVPEPAPIALFALAGLFWIGGVVRKRQAAH